MGSNTDAPHKDRSGRLVVDACGVAVRLPENLVTLGILLPSVSYLAPIVTSKMGTPCNNVVDWNRLGCGGSSQ